MNISSIAGNAAAGGKTDTDPAVASLQQYKNQLKNELKKVQESKDDSKTKAEKIKEITAQIAEVDTRIQQAIMEAKRRKMQEAQDKAAGKAEEENNPKNNEEGFVVDDSLNKVISLQNNMNDYLNMGSVRTKLIGEINVAESQIKHSLPGGSTKYQQELIAIDESQVAKVEHDMGKKAGEIRRGLEQSVEKGVKEAQRDRENDKEKDDKVAEGQTENDNKVSFDSAEVISADNATANLDETSQKDQKDSDREKQPKQVDIKA